MPDNSLQHADTFFFITTIAVVVGIVILLVLLYICLRVVKTVRNMASKTNLILDKASDAAEDSLRQETPLKKSLPLLLPLAAMVFGKKEKKKTSDK